MPLTPADIHNVEFRRPPLGQRGYDDVAVDAFLDLAAREFAHLIAENRALRERRRLSAGARTPEPSHPATTADERTLPSDAGRPARADGAFPDSSAASPTASSGEQSPSTVRQSESGQRPSRAGQPAALAARLKRLKAEQAQAEQRVRDIRAELEHAQRSTPQRPPHIDDRVMALAQRTADEHLREADEHARTLLTAARTEAARLTSDAALHASTIDSDARHRHTEAVNDLAGRRATALAEIKRLTEIARAEREQLLLRIGDRLRDLTGP